MADLLAILSQGASSLSAHRAAAATAGHNLENVNTPGYSRQRAELEAVLHAQQLGGNAYLGRGVSLQTISQARDRFLEAQIPTANAAAARAEAQSTALLAVHTLDPDAAGNLTSSIGDFYSSLRALSQNPGSAVLRQAAVDAGRALSLSFNRAAGEIDQARTGLDQKLAGMTDTINEMAGRMASLNREIRQAVAAGGQPNDLLDARAQLRDQLASLTGATPVPDGGGDLNMALPDGTALVSGDRAASLSATPDPANGGHLSLQATLADGRGTTTLKGIGGTLGGLIDARDGALLQAGQGLDQLAWDLAGEVNAVHQGGFALDGSPGGDFFDAGPGAQGAASRLAVDSALLADPSRLAAASSPTTVPGDAANLFLLIDTETRALSGGVDAEGALSKITSAFGAAASAASLSAEHEGALRDHLESMRESVSGVSIDEEMIEMTKAQRAFEAVSKVITATQDMLDTLMQLK